MSNPNEDLSQRIEQLEKELMLMRKQMATIEAKLDGNIHSTEQSYVQQVAKPKKKNQQEQQYGHAKTAEKHSLIKKPKAKQQPQRKLKDPISIEQLLGIWLPRIFMFVLILGVLWGLKIGMDQGWISYGVRIALGYVATFLLLYIGSRNFKKEQKIFAITLFGGLITIGILVTMAAYYLYDLFTYPVAFIIGLFYILFGLVISKKTSSETLAIFSGIGGFLLPFLITGGTVQAWTFCLYILTLFLSLFYIALQSKHKVSYYVTFILFHLTLLVYTTNVLQPNEETFIVATALIQHVVILFFYVRGAISREIFSETLMYTNVVFMLGWITLLEKNNDIIVFGAFAALYIALTFYAYSRKDVKFQSIFSAIAILALSAFILSFQLEHFEIELLLLLINGAAGIWIGLRFRTLRTIIISSLIYTLVMLITIAFVDPPKWISIGQLTWIGLITTLIFIYYGLYRNGTKQFGIKIKSIDFSLIGGQLVTLIYIYKLVDIAMQDKIAYTDWDFRTHMQLFILTIAITLTFFAHKWKHGIYLTHAAAIQFLLLGFYFAVSPITYIQQRSYFAFTLFAEILYLVLFTALFLLIMKNKFPGTNKLSKYVANFAVVVQLTYLFFLHKWYFAITDLFVDNYEYAYIGHTLWLFLFAFLSISLGIRSQWKLVRIIGFGLVGFSLIKLFFFDLINVSIIVRAVLFIVVGVIGLVYSRTLLKDDEQRSNGEE